MPVSRGFGRALAIAEATVNNSASALAAAESDVDCSARCLGKVIKPLRSATRRGRKRRGPAEN